MKHPKLVHGLELLPCAIRDGILYIPHADGQWVSAAKLQPFSLAIIEHWRAEQDLATSNTPAPVAVTREPLSDAQMRRACPPVRYGVEGLSNFMAGARFAESHHGIGASPAGAEGAGS